MKIVQINATCEVGSTGKICASISDLLDEKKVQNWIFYTHGVSKRKNAIKYADTIETKLNAAKSKIFGNYGFNSKSMTKKLIILLDRIEPDIVHLHNMHGHNCNLEILLNYLKSRKIKVIWTFHDCWTFTAYCPYFTIAKCDKWKTGCNKCPQNKQFSYIIDRSKKLWEMKKNLLNGLDLTIVTPSYWLADLVKQSFLKDYPVKVIHNGINLDLFKPVKSDFRQKYQLNEKYILLGVAFAWGNRKGLDVFIELANRLDDRYQIVLVGTNNDVDKKLPNNIISIHRTNNQKELAEIYTAADLYVNPTREEVLGLVNIESLACGTPVITFNTGGSPECIDCDSGCVVDVDNISELEKQIKYFTEKPLNAKNCMKRAMDFDEKKKYREYIDLYFEE